MACGVCEWVGNRVSGQLGASVGGTAPCVPRLPDGHLTDGGVTPHSPPLQREALGASVGTDIPFCWQYALMCLSDAKSLAST